MMVMWRKRQNDQAHNKGMHKLAQKEYMTRHDWMVKVIH